MYASDGPVRPNDVQHATNNPSESRLHPAKILEEPRDRGETISDLSRVYISSSPHTPDRSSLIVRPHRPKPSRSLNQAQVEMIIAGGHHAHRIGYPLNRFITIDWDVAKVVDPWAAQSAFIKYIRDWLRRHDGGSATYAWVIENGPQLGLHSHMMIHIPPALIKQFSQHQRRWLRKIGIHPHMRGAVHTVPIGHSYWAGIDGGVGTQAYQHKLACLTDYLLKAATPVARKEYAIKHMPQYSLVPGKRAGTSLNIAPKAVNKWYQGRRPKGPDNVPGQPVPPLKQHR